MGHSVRALEVLGTDGMGHVAIAAGAWVDALGIHIDDAITIAVVPLAGAACVLCGQAIPAGQIAGAVGRIGHLVAIRLVGAHPAGGLGVWNTDAAGLLKDIAHPAHTLYQLTILADQVLIAVCRVTYNGSLRDASLAGAVLHTSLLARSARSVFRADIFGVLAANANGGVEVGVIGASAILPLATDAVLVCPAVFSTCWRILGIALVNGTSFNG